MPHLLANAITPDTTIPLGMMWVILGAVVVGTSAAVGIFVRLGNLTKVVKYVVAHGWTVADHTLWSEKLGRQNPTLNVPEVKKATPGETVVE